MKQGRYGHMLQLVERVKTEELFTADELLHLGYVCLQVPRNPHAPSAKAAFSAALQLMRSQQEPPCMDTLAEVHAWLSTILISQNSKLTDTA